MDPRLTKICEVLNTVRPEIMKRRYVVATGIGYKVTAGKTTSALAIICSVQCKRPIRNLKKADVIQPVIQGVPTDVRETGYINAFQSPTDRFRPCPAGVSIGHIDITAGTFGCLVTKNRELFILSNNHVLANNNEAAIGDPILQPGLYDGARDPQDRLGYLSEFVPIGFSEEIPENSKGHPLIGTIATLLNVLSAFLGSSIRLKQYRAQKIINFVDAALAKPIDVKNVTNDIMGIGKIKGVSEGTLGMAIKKSGRTTGLTHGSIEQIAVSVKVSYGPNRTALFEDQLMAGAMSSGGDSGSAVVDGDNRFIGLLFAGSETSTIINKSSHVMNQLNIAMVDELANTA